MMFSEQQTPRSSASIQNRLRQDEDNPGYHVQDQQYLISRLQYQNALKDEAIHKASRIINELRQQISMLKENNLRLKMESQQEMERYKSSLETMRQQFTYQYGQKTLSSQRQNKKLRQQLHRREKEFIAQLRDSRKDMIEQRFDNYLSVNLDSESKTPNASCITLNPVKMTEQKLATGTTTSPNKQSQKAQLFRSKTQHSHSSSTKKKPPKQIIRMTPIHQYRKHVHNTSTFNTIGEPTNDNINREVDLLKSQMNDLRDRLDRKDNEILCLLKYNRAVSQSQPGSNSKPSAVVTTAQKPQHTPFKPRNIKDYYLHRAYPTYY